MSERDGRGLVGRAIRVLVGSRDSGEAPVRTVADLVRVRAEAAAWAEVAAWPAPEPAAPAELPVADPTPPGPAMAEPSTTDPGPVPLADPPAPLAEPPAPAPPFAPPWEPPRPADLGGSPTTEDLAAPTREQDATLAPPWVRAALMGVPQRITAPTADQAAATRALRRTFGFPPELRPVTLASAAEPAALRPGSGARVDVRFRAVRRDGSAVAGAEVVLLDDGGATAATAVAGPDGRGAVGVQPGAYLLVVSASGEQPSALAIVVAGAPLDVDVPVVRSASLCGTVRHAGRPVAGAQVTLVQDGDVVDLVSTGASGRYRIGDLTAGEYALAVAADGCAPSVEVIDVAEEADLVHDVGLVERVVAAAP